jgi:BirA family biotin operon repressor/biotin-[acetyl-CoA-carboxylase] ligase
LIRYASLLAASAAAHAVAAATDQHPKVRWPNDLVLNGRKLGGVLVETVALDGDKRGVVIGMGINCYQHAGHFPVEIADIATSLEIASSQPVERVEVARRLLCELDERLDAARRAFSAASVLQEWKDLCEDWQMRVTLLHDGRRYHGTILDISDEADLIVQLDIGGCRHFGSATTTRLWKA